jgi:hypothetical protein
MDPKAGWTLVVLFLAALLLLVLVGAQHLGSGGVSGAVPIEEAVAFGAAERPLSRSKVLDVPAERRVPVGESAAVEVDPTLPPVGAEIDDIGDPPEEEGEGHDDPLEHGSSALRITLVEKADHEPLASFIWLVRLDAPGNEFWEHGDHVQARLDIPKEGLWIPGLPEGMYRVACWQRLEGEPDSEPFLVAGPRTEVEIELVVRGPRPVRLLVNDAFGPSAATLYLVSADELGGASLARVDWIMPRLPKGDELWFESFVGEPDFGPPPRGLPIEAQTGVFVLGEVPAPTRGHPDPTLFVLDDPGVSRITVLADWDHADGKRWAAVRVPTSTIAAAIRLEDGAPPDPALLEIEATCEALPAEEETNTDPCLDTELAITATYPAREPLHFRWKPATGQLALQYFAPPLAE